MKIAVVTCYRDADYIRARALRASLASLEDVEVIVIKNKSTGVKRYLEVIAQVIKARIKQHPDVYILTFRGYEMLPIMRLLTAGKPLIFDELVNAVEWFVYEHKKLSGLAAKILAVGYGFWARTTRFILADTSTHADVSSALSKVDRRKYVVVPVSTDEAAFPYRPMAPRQPGMPLRVFFYSYMLPLHGPEYVLEAAEMLKDNPNISFLIAGRTGKYTARIEAAKARGARIQYRDWVPFDEIARLVAESGVNIAGPFGNTFQAKHVINGKVFQFLASGSVALLGANKNTDYFVNHVNCLIVPQGDAQAIAREIDWAYNNQDQLPAIAAAGRALYDQYYSNRVIAENLRQMLAQLKR